MLKINKKKNIIIISYCGFTLSKTFSEYPYNTPNDIALALINEIRIKNGIPVSSFPVNCDLIKILSDGTEIYEIR